MADANVARTWRGSDGGSSDYDRACLQLRSDPDAPGIQWGFNACQSIIWDPYGPGTGDAFSEGTDRLVFIRAWLDEPADADTDDELATVSALVLLPSNEAVSLGTLEITSGVLAILWAPESGECIEPSDIESLRLNESTRPSGEMSSDSSGLLVKMATGIYTCFHDEIELGGSSARRCHLIKNAV